MPKQKKKAARRPKARKLRPAPTHPDPDDIDPQRYIDAVVRERHEKIPGELRERLLAAGFSDVRVTHGVEQGFYEAVMERGDNQRCGTTTEAAEFFRALTEEIGGELANGAVGILVFHSRIRVAFILSY